MASLLSLLDMESLSFLLRGAELANGVPHGFRTMFQFDIEFKSLDQGGRCALCVERATVVPEQVLESGELAVRQVGVEIEPLRIKQARQMHFVLFCVHITERERSRECDAGEKVGSLEDSGRRKLGERPRPEKQCEQHSRGQATPAEQQLGGGTKAWRMSSGSCLLYTSPSPRDS